MFFVDYHMHRKTGEFVADFPAEKYDVITVSDLTFVKTKTTLDSWYCKHCDVFHDRHTTRINYMSTFAKHHMCVSVCAEHVNRAYVPCYCYHCGTIAKDEYLFTMLYYGVETHVLHCSAECWKTSMKTYKQTPTWQTICRNCGEAFEKCKRCSVCKITYYCSVACQRADWPRHKATCFSH